MSEFALWIVYDKRLLTRTDYSTWKREQLLIALRANAARVIAGNY